MTNPRHLRIRFALVILLAGWAALASAATPFADIHVHFNWDHKELIDADAVVDRLIDADVEFALVSATPTELALELQRAGGRRIIPFFSPYIRARGRHDWHLDARVVQLAEQGLRRGLYQGIGEVHFMAGFRPRLDNANFRRLLELAAEYEIPVLVHVDSANESRFIELCSGHPQLDLIFAHAGGNLRSEHIRRIVEACPRAWIEFSARDPWRYGGLTDAGGRLLPGWRELVLEHPARFMTGTDPVWKVTRTQTWDQADEGWDYHAQLMDYHRRWIGDLPASVQRAIRVGNARRLFGRKPEPVSSTQQAVAE